MREHDPLVHEYQHERRLPREFEALYVLRKIASLVKPIMRRRSWSVGTLCEFYPRERNLLGLNINGGQKICLRLRYQSDDRQFLPVEQVVDTMLHELCHNVHGPHNQQFHALWNQLRDEHDDLIRKGYTGEGFLSDGRRLGGRKMPIDEARRAARAAAEQRRSLSAGSGRRVGGTPILRGTDMRRVIADAAQRRIEVTQGCASGTQAGVELAEEASRNGFRTKAEEDSANEQAITQAYIELMEEDERERYGSSYVPPSQQNPTGGCPGDGELRPPQSITVDTDTDTSTRTETNSDGPWTCPTCTLENPPNYLCCDACASERPSSDATLPPPSTQELVQQRHQEREWERRKKQQQQQQQQRDQDRDKQNQYLRNAKRPRPAETDTSFGFRNRTRALQSLSTLDRDAQKRPLGWLCQYCGAFMETEWWTCSSCGMMKGAS